MKTYHHYPLFFCVVALLFFVEKTQAQKIHLDTIQKYLALQRNDTTHVNYLITKLRDHIPPLQITETQQLSKEVITLSEKLNFPKGIVAGTLILSRPLIMTGKFEAAEQILLPIADLAKRENLHTQSGSIENNLGIICQNTGRKEAATSHFICAAEAFGRANNVPLQAAVLGNLATTFLQNNQVEKASIYIEKAYYANLKNRDTLKAAYFLLNRGIIQKRKSQWNDANATFLEVLNIVKKYPKDAELVYGAYSNLGELKFAQNDYNNAQNYHFEGLKIAQQLNSKDKIALSLQYLANIFLKKGDVYQAEKYINDALSLAKQSNEKSRLNDIFAVAADIKNTIGKKDEAIALLQQSQNRQDSVANINIATNVNELEIRYQTEQKNRQIAEQSLSIARRNQYLLLLSLFFSTSLVAFWYYRIRQKQQLEKIKQQQTLALLEANMSGEQQERSRVAQELHDAIGGLLAAAKLHFAAAKNQNQSYEKGIIILDEAAIETRRISHNLMPEVLLQKGIVTAIADYTKNFGQKNDLDIDVQMYDVPLLSDKMSLAIYRIVQETLHNTLKHAAAKNILIQLNGSPKNISLTIEDDGIGFDKNQIIKGLGLKNIEKRIAAMNGTIDIRSQKDKGTSFFIQLPNDEVMKY